MARNNYKAFIDEQDFRTWWLLHQASDASFRVRNRELSQYGITPEQAAILLIVKILIRTKRKPTPGEISKWILREPDSASKILTRMERDGFIIKNSGLGKKKNEVHVTLTGKGEKAYKYSLKRDSIHEMMSCLSKEEHLELSSLLIKLRDKALQDLAKKSEAVFP